MKTTPSCNWSYANILKQEKVIPGAGGLRKIRWKGSGRGKRGGTRIIYYWWVNKEKISMLLAYPKNEREDLTKDQIKILKKLMEEDE